MKSMWREWVSYLLWRMGLRRVLPRQIVNRVRVVECGEKLVTVSESRRLRVRGVSGVEVRLREGAVQRLILASERLPDGFCLILVEGYRSPTRQKALWNQQLSAVRGASPNISNEEVARLTRLRIAQPSAIGGGHQTGGAVDVTLADAKGIELDMGTRVQEFSNLAPTLSRPLPADVRERRRILCSAMERADFANYPGEWWHFSYGDRMWAAYRRKRNAIYGAAVGLMCEFL